MNNYIKLLLLFLLLSASACGGDRSRGSGAPNSIDDRVINGVSFDGSLQGASSSVVRVSFSYEDGSSGFCSGVLIAPTAAITSGHCIIEGNPKPVSVTAVDGSVATITSSIVHPDYRVDEDAGAIFGDVAVVRIAPALSIPTAPLLQSVSIGSSEVVTIAGYGVDESGAFGELKFGTMTISLATENHLLAFFSGESSNTCNGDSGGPAIARAMTIDGNGIEGIVGLISSGSRDDCKAGDTTYFTNLQNAGIASWIIEQTPEVTLQ